MPVALSAQLKSRAAARAELLHSALGSGGFFDGPDRRNVAGREDYQWRGGITGILAKKVSFNLAIARL